MFKKNIIINENLSNYLLKDYFKMKKPTDPKRLPN